MARLARLVLPGVPYHVTQRGKWIADVEERSGRTLAPKKRGPKPMAKAAGG